MFLTLCIVMQIYKILICGYSLFEEGTKLILLKKQVRYIRLLLERTDAFNEASGDDKVFTVDLSEI